MSPVISRRVARAERSVNVRATPATAARLFVLCAVLSTYTPHIRRLPHLPRPHIALAEHLRRAVVRRPRHIVDDFIILRHFGTPEVNELHVGVFTLCVKHEILGFEIPVNNVVSMAVIEGLNHFLRESRGNFLAERPVLDSIEQLSPLAQHRE